MALVRSRLGRCQKWITFENVFKAIVLLLVWGLLSIPVVVYYTSKEKSTSPAWLDNISELLQSLEGNCGGEFNGTSNGTVVGNVTLDCFSYQSASQVGDLRECGLANACVGQITLVPVWFFFCNSAIVLGASACRSALDCVHLASRGKLGAQCNLTIHC